MRLPDARATAVALAAAAVLRLSAAPPADPAGLLRAVGARVADYYQRAQHVMCTEIATVQPIDRDWSPQGLGRTVESDLRVEADGAVGDRLPEPRVVRGIRRINGRSPRPSDSTSRNGCTNPDPLSPEPLAFLLPQHREDYRFTSVRDGREQCSFTVWANFEKSVFDCSSSAGVITSASVPRFAASCFGAIIPSATRPRQIIGHLPIMIGAPRWLKPPIRVRWPHPRYDWTIRVLCPATAEGSPPPLTQPQPSPHEGIIRASGYTWERTAEMTADVYESVATFVPPR